MNNRTKVCRVCKINKSLDLYDNEKLVKDGKKAQCKICRSARKKELRLNNLQQSRIKERDRARKRRNIKGEELKIKAHKRYIKNKQKIIDYVINYRIVNYKEFRKSVNKRSKIRENEDIQYKLRRRLRNRLRAILKKQETKLTKSSVDYLGCSLSELKSYIEILFKNGMNWNNYGAGKDKWSIDHIYPLSKLDLTKEENIKKACHYTNLQPLWNIDNIKKSNKLPENI